MKPSERRKARHYAMQAIYQSGFTDDPAIQLIRQFQEDYNFSKVDSEYFVELVKGILKNKNELDEELKPFIDMPFEDITPVELAILRLGAFELAHRIDTPYKVVINEAIALAKKFGTDDGSKFVNGILDKVARKLRAVEINSS